MLHALLIVTTLLSSSMSPSALTKDPSNITDNAISINSFDSAVFPLQGNLDTDGAYHVVMEIGNPPEKYSLRVDTGGDFTWLQCDPDGLGPPAKYKPKKDGRVKCRDAKCSWFPDPRPPYNRNCDKDPNLCYYEIKYADGFTCNGIVATDVFNLKLSNGNEVQTSSLALGCGYESMDREGKQLPVDGILGLGHGKASIISQLNNQEIIRNIVGHCLSRKNTGYLFFGNDLVPTAGVNWAHISTTADHYQVQKLPSIYYGKKHLDIKKPAPVMFDSGATTMYFADQTYKEVLLELENDLKNKQLKRVTDLEKSDSVCWKGAKPFKSFDDVKKLFNALVLKFDGVQYEIPPENYLFITYQGNACLEIFEISRYIPEDLNVIGARGMLDMMVIYDNEGHRVGWTKKNC